MLTDYQEIYTGDIFARSNCIWHENVMMDWFRSHLVSLGYVSTGGTNKVWRRDERTVVTCLVDDISTCSNQDDPYVPRLWDPSVMVLTDNHVICPTRYSVYQLPPSWFGIYAYDCREAAWQPDRRFNFSINRLDMKRLLLFLEYRKRLPWETDRDVMDYVNFNCWSWDGDNSTPQGILDNFERTYASLVQKAQDVHQITKETDIPPMPWRNHDLDLETSMHRAWINLVIETYSGDSIIALSEKIFRALVTPVPWMVYAGRHTVVYLESLGFDCLSDVIDHGYDTMIETRTVDYGDKVVDWFWKATENYANLRAQNFQQLLQRCQRAATTNQELLQNFRRSWPLDFSNWWTTIIGKL